MRIQNNIYYQQKKRYSYELAFRCLQCNKVIIEDLTKYLKFHKEDQMRVYDIVNFIEHSESIGMRTHYCAEESDFVGNRSDTVVGVLKIIGFSYRKDEKCIE